MADQKISALTADVSPTGDDLVVTVTDPAGTPASRKTTITDLLEFFTSEGTALTDLAAAGGDMDTDDTVYGEEDGSPKKFTQANVVTATRVNTAGAVMESDYDANTVLAATADNTPAALTVAEQRVVGRVTGGAIDDLTGTQVLAITGQGVVDTDPGVVVASTNVATTLLASGPLVIPTCALGDEVSYRAFGNMANFEGTNRTMLIRTTVGGDQIFNATAYTIVNATIINWEFEVKIPFVQINAAATLVAPARLWIGTSAGFVDTAVSKLTSATITTDTTGAVNVTLEATPAVSSAALTCTCLGASLVRSRPIA